jgi:predicted ribosomally synthesized peptide with SipW-like signal peptide
MSKKTILCTVLALCMVLVGTGYAYWTDTLNVTTKATTGDLEVKFVDLGAYAQYDNEKVGGNNWSIIDGIKRENTNGFISANYFQRNTNTYNDVFGSPDKRLDYYAEASNYNSVDFDAGIDGGVLTENYGGLPYGEGVIAGDTINITVNDLYPGYAQAFRSDIINIGSIAARLSQVEFKVSKIKGSEIDITKQTKDLIGVALLVEDENPETYGEVVKLAAQFDPEDKFTLGGVEFVRLSALENMAELEENLILVPSDNSEHRMDMFIGVAVDPDAEGVYTTGTAANMTKNDDGKTQNKGVQLDIKFGWDQFNAGVEADASNILENQNGLNQ